jgi:flavodoxin I
MGKSRLFYGSTTGNTAMVAEKLKEALSPLGTVNLHAVGESGLSPAESADLVLFGVSTWGVGELQEDWVKYDSLPGLNLSGKYAAVFGTGDQVGFADSFVDALGILSDKAVAAGASLVGAWPTNGYDYSSSTAERDGKLVGLAIDEENQSDLTDERIEAWAAQVREEVTR